MADKPTDIRGSTFDTVKHQTLVNCTEKIIAGLSCEPKTLGDSLHGKGLISTEVLREITEVPATKTDNARKLYFSILEAVRHYPGKYFDFISVLRGNTLLYSDLLKVLEQTYKEKKDAENQCNVPTPKTSHGDSSLVPSSAEQVKYFEDRFYELRTSALTDVMDKNIPVACFRQTLTNLPNAISKENEEFVIEKYSTFKKAESVEDIFLHLNFYLSFLDFSLLEHIIEHFGSFSLQCKMKQYSMDMGLFRAETSVADIIPHLSGRPEPPPHFARLKMKLNFDPQTCTLEYLEQHRRNFGSVCSLSKFTLFLVELQEGSLVEIWLIPLNCVPILKDLIQEKNVTRVFLHLDILELSVNNECLYPFSTPKDAVDTPAVISLSEIVSQTSFPEQSTSSVPPPVLVPTHIHDDIPSILSPLPDDTTLPENVILPSGDPPHVFPATSPPNPHTSVSNNDCKQPLPMSGAPMIQYPPQTEPGLTQPLTTEPDCATILATQFPNLEFRDYSFTPPQYQVPYYRSVVYDKVVGPQSLIGDSVTYFVSVQHARNIAAKDVLAKLESRQAPGNPSVQEARIENVPRTPANVPGSTYKEQMQTFFQVNKINPQFEYHSDNTLGPSTYRCIIRYTFNGQPNTISTGQYFSKKADAKEQVAKQVLAKEGFPDKRSISGVLSKGPSPPTKVYKSRLKELFDKKRLVVEIRYSTVASGNGFFSTVCLPESTQIRGEVCKSKQEAEQSAAHQALVYYGE